MWHGLFGSSWAVGVSSTCIKRLETTAARAVVAFRWLPRITPPLPPMSACNRLIPLRSLQLLGRQAFCPALRGMAVTVGAHRRSWSVPVANGLFPRFSSTGATTVQSIPEFGMKDKIVLITGGARGLGFTQAKGLIEAGAKVHAVDIAKAPSAEFQKFQSQHPEALFYHNVDVCSQEALNAEVQQIAEQHGRFDGCIAAAGILEEVDATDYTAAQFKKIIDVNVLGVFLTAQAVARQMIRFGNGGSVVLIASMSATIANKGVPMTAYNTSKGAVAQMARNLASEWGKYGIRVNSLSPGYILTDMVKIQLDKMPDRAARYPTENMLGRLSQPEEYRGVAVFLLSGASSYMTGSDLIMDGGHTRW